MVIKREGLTFIFDIDGTLASKGYSNVSTGKLPPIRKTLKIALAAQKSDRSKMVIITARPESLREVTESWIKNLGLKPEFLLMRSSKDFRPDYEVRVDQIRKVMKALGKNVVLYDDKATNCKAVRKKLKIPVRLVKEND
jgi:hypothetical protein